MIRKAILSTLTLGAVATSANAALIINEVYAGGGSGTAGTTSTRDFVELYNTGGTAVNLDGYKLQYASSAGLFTNTIFNFITGSSIGAADYLSIATGSAGTAGATLNVGSDVTASAPTNNASISNTAGAVRLIDPTGAVVDLIGFGSVTSPASDGSLKVETTAAAAPTSTAVSLNRTAFIDTNVNLADFTSATPTPQAGSSSTAVTPEPASLALLGLVGLAGMRRRR